MAKSSSMGYVAPAEGAVRRPLCGSVMPWPAQANWLICERLSNSVLNCRTVRRLDNASSRLTGPFKLGSVSWIIICGARDLLRPRQSVAKQAKTIARIVKRFIFLILQNKFFQAAVHNRYTYIIHSIPDFPD